MKTINRNVLQSDIDYAIDAVNEYDSVKGPAAKAAFFCGYFGRKYPEIATLLSYIAEIEATSLTGEGKP